jgi:hypothetical protein
MGTVRICGIDWTGTGTSGIEVCFGENRRRGCGFGLTTMKMAMRAERAAANVSSTSPDALSSTYPPKVELGWGTRFSLGFYCVGPGGAGSARFRRYGRWRCWAALMGGLWKSTNAGSQNSNPALVTWQALIDDQPTLAVGAIALQPGNSNVVLVGTSQITVTATAAGGTSHGDLVTLIVQ